ncbi:MULTISPECIES: RnfABCDGE type electron transport complex subunit G [unclassified Pseudomonas]|jgi:electron transport complex protein RnfG|uniref:RnfABCDGE type electron transport complex subunit G n=1 Tax=unclassified Pseudomonas TaxID=196821 RepID=UPI0019129247|nr:MULTISPECIES: RnfABCDGE type electron transport complex subunit G [unclassified Pseudomonas]MBK5516582.1 RnfABCDGE type electron transport complex subunit G [Pseudomonas sp. TH10]MCA4962641.1 RnfABCDGE type electron transport complex subunit G [Pseudomonas sp. Y24-6]
MNRTTSIATLALLAVLGTGVTWFVQHTAAPRIAEQQRLLDSRHLLDMLAPDSYDNQPLEQPLSLADVKLAHSTLLGGYRATRSGKVIALLLRSQTLGYAGSIDLMIAIGPDGRLLAVKTLKHSETQGLGAHIADSPQGWLQVFAGRSRADPVDAGWALKKDQGQFDQIAGATITSRAAINAIHDALRYFDEHRQALIGGSDE